jgi:hypothetical protein
MMRGKEDNNRPFPLIINSMTSLEIKAAECNGGIETGDM